MFHSGRGFSPKYWWLDTHRKKADTLNCWTEYSMPARKEERQSWEREERKRGESRKVEEWARHKGGTENERAGWCFHKSKNGADVKRMIQWAEVMIQRMPSCCDLTDDLTVCDGYCECTDRHVNVNVPNGLLDWILLARCLGHWLVYHIVVTRWKVYLLE